MVNEWSCWLFGGLASGRRKTGQFPAVFLESCEATAHAKHQEWRKQSISGGPREERGVGGVRSMRGQSITICVCVAIVSCSGSLYVAGSLHTLWFQWESKPLDSPKKGAAGREWTVGKSFHSTSACQAVGMPYLKSKEKQCNTGGSLSFFLLNVINFPIKMYKTKQKYHPKPTTDGTDWNIPKLNIRGKKDKAEWMCVDV